MPHGEQHPEPGPRPEPQQRSGAGGGADRYQAATGAVSQNPDQLNELHPSFRYFDRRRPIGEPEEGTAIAGPPGHPGGTTRTFTKQETVIERDPDKIEEFQIWATANGLLTVEYIPGVLDLNTQAAFITMMTTAEAHGITDPEEAMALISSSGGFTEDEEKGRGPFTAPPFQPRTDESVRAGVVAGLQATEGRATDEDIRRFTGAFREAERRHHDERTAYQRSAHFEQEGAGPVTQLEAPQQFVSSANEADDDSAVYHGSLLLLDFQNALGGGAI